MAGSLHWLLLLLQDKVAGRWHLAPVEGGVRPLKLTVRRDALLEDAYAGLAGAGAGIKARLQVCARVALHMPAGGCHVMRRDAAWCADCLSMLPRMPRVVAAMLLR